MPGTVVTSVARPAPAARAIRQIPSAVPTTCRTVRVSPNSAPDAQSRTLFGPGVTELTNEKATSARMGSTTRTVGRRDGPGLVRFCDGRTGRDPRDPGME